MLKLRRRTVADCLMAILILGSSTAFAAKQEPAKPPISREKVRLILLDNCVMDEWKTREVKDRIADQCKCASAKVARQMPDADIKGFKDKLPKTATPAWQAAMKYCINPPRPKPPAAAKVEEPAKTDAPAAVPATTEPGATDNAATGSTGDGGGTPPPAQ
jgi:hypothetical protein